MRMKACPFCANKNIKIKLGEHADISFITCNGCGAIVSFAPYLKGNKAITAWNKRRYREPAPSTTVANMSDTGRFSDGDIPF